MGVDPPPPTSASSGPPEVRELALELIRRSPDQPRRRFEAGALEALALSLQSSNGVIEPVLVRPVDGTYELVAGERRWRAAHLAGLTHILAVVRELDDETAFELSLAENSAREDLTPIEEARAYARLCDRHALSKAEIARRVGRSREAVSNLIRLLELPDSVLELIDSGALSEAHGRALLTCHDHTRRRTLARQAAAGGWSVRTLEAMAREAGPGHVPATRATPAVLHPDQVEVVGELDALFSAALRREVQVTPSGELYQVTVTVSDAQDALDLLQTLRRSDSARSKDRP